MNFTTAMPKSQYKNMPAEADMQIASAGTQQISYK